MKPYLCKLNLQPHEDEFGFMYQRQNCLYVKSIEPDSAADSCGIKKGDIILELNGLDTIYLSTNQIREIIEKGRQDRKLEMLVIDIDGYRYARYQRH